MTAAVAIVTGAARGLGFGIVERLVAEGWCVAGVDLDANIAAALEALATPERTLAIRADVSNPDATLEVAQAVSQRWGRIDALVNNAGVGGPSTPVHETDPFEFEYVLRVNLVAPFLMARAVVPEIIASASRRAVVNVGSVLGQQGEAGSGAYSASKAGLALLGQSMALELAPHRIRVNTVAPGNMMTAMHEEHVAELASLTGRTYDEAVVAVLESVPLGRHGTPADVGAVVAWLLSPDASYVTGQTIAVNGGVFCT